VPRAGEAKLRLAFLPHVARLSEAGIGLRRLIAAADGMSSTVIPAEGRPLAGAVRDAGPQVEVPAISPHTPCASFVSGMCTNGNSIPGQFYDHDSLRVILGDGSSPRRSLSLAWVGAYAGGVQWAGDGLDHPPLRNRDVLAFLPFQASDHLFVVPIYVMTRNMATVYRSAAGPERYDLPPERFQMTIGGTDAAQAKVSATDPLTGESVPVTVVDRTATGWLVVEMPVTDSPRLLVIDDRAP
jgi:hypothetical protein